MFNNPFPNSGGSSLPTTATTGTASGNSGITPNTGALVPFGSIQQSNPVSSLFGTTSFGSSSTNSTQQPSSTLFGGSSNTTSVNAPTEIFNTSGTPSFGTVSAFGGPSTGFGAGSTMNTTPAFGSTSSQNLFGGNTSSGFGSVFPSNPNTLFQTSATNQPTTNVSFGSSSNTAPLSQSTTTSSGLFGNTPSSTSNVFGTSSNPPTATFGLNPQSNATNRGLFGSGITTSTTPSPFATTGTASLFGTNAAPSTTMTPFGTTQTSSGFNTTSTPFGMSNITSGGNTGLFGTTTTQPSSVFGSGTASGSSMLSGNTTGTGFNASPFGSTVLSSATPSLGTGSPPFSATTDNDNQSIIQLQTISAMPAYVAKSVEELRLEDYHRGRKAPGYGPPSSATPSFSSTSTNTFGSGSIFGSQQTTTPTFVSQPATSPFGTQSVTSPFGAQQTTVAPFGSQSVANPQQSSSIFGSGLSSTTPTQSTANTLFQNTSTTFPQQSSGRIPFGGNNTTITTQPQGTGFFGSLGTSSTTSQPFGTTSTNPQPFAFGNTTGGSLHNTQSLFQPSSSSAGSGIFGQQTQGSMTPTTTTLQSFPSASTNQMSLFPSTKSTNNTSTFPNTGSSFLFPSSTVPSTSVSTGLFPGSSVPSNSSMVNSSTMPAFQQMTTTTPSSMFPTLSNFNTMPVSTTGMGTNTSSSLFPSIGTSSNLFTSTSTPSVASGTTTSMMPSSVMTTTPFGVNNSGSTTYLTSRPQFSSTPLTPFTLPWPNTNSTTVPFTNLGTSTLPMTSLSTGLLTPSNDTTPKPSSQFGKHPWLDAPPTPISTPLNSTQANTHRSPSMITNGLLKQIGKSSLPTQNQQSLSSDNFFLQKYIKSYSSRDLAKVSLRPAMLTTLPSPALSVKRSLKSLVVDISRNSTHNKNLNVAKHDNSKQTDPHLINKLLIQSEDGIVSNSKELNGTRSRVQSLHGGFYISPPISDILTAWKDRSEGSCTLLVKDFLLGRKHFGDVFFLSSVDISFLPLDDECAFIGTLFGKEALLPTIQSHPEEYDFPIVSFGVRSITVYPEGMVKPPIGSGLNVPARIRLEGCYPRRPDAVPTSQSSMDIQLIDLFVKKLQAVPGTSFVSYDDATGLWVFTVDHF